MSDLLAPYAEALPQEPENLADDRKAFHLIQKKKMKGFDELLSKNPDGF